MIVVAIGSLFLVLRYRVTSAQAPTGRQVLYSQIRSNNVERLPAIGPQLLSELVGSSTKTSGNVSGNARSIKRPHVVATTLNLSQDLVPLGIASTNMVPNQPSLDAGPLFEQGVAYAMSHQMDRVIADKGTYYFLSLQSPGGHVQLGGNPITPFVSNLTIDFQGSDLIFTHPLLYGISLFAASNVVLENFTADYQPLPFTQVRVVAVDPLTARIQYSVEPGWQDPSAFNSAQQLPGAGFPPVEAHVYRNGRPVVGTIRMAVQTPLSGNTFTLVPYISFNPTPANVAKIRPGDVVVLDMRQSASPVVTYRCHGCTLRNITVYAASGGAITGMYSDSTTWERIYSIPKPGTDRLISSLEIDFQAAGPNNQIRLSRAIRTLDGGITLFVWSTGEVESQQSARTLTVAGVCCTTLGQGVTLANGSPVVFQRPSDGAIVASAVLVSQTGSVDAYNPDHLSYTFDRDLPGNLVGSLIYTTDFNQRGANSLIERNTVQEKGTCCTGMDIYGWTGSTVHGNYINRTAYAAILGVASTAPNGAWDTPPLENMTFSNNVMDLGNQVADWWLPQMGAIEMETVRWDAQEGDYDLMPGPHHQNITMTGNFIDDPGRAAIWIGGTSGANVTGNYLLHPNERPTLGIYHPPRTDVMGPLIVDPTSNGIVTANNTIDQTSGRVLVTDTQFRELAAYPPGGTLRLSAYNVGTLANPAVTLTDGDGVTRPVSIQNTTAHALDVLIPAGAALGGAYITLTANGTKFFGTLFIDSQDNIPAVNGCIYETSVLSTSVPNTATNVPILVVTQPGCSYQAVDSDPFVNITAGGTGTSVISLNLSSNIGAARSTTLEIAGAPITLTQAAAPSPQLLLDQSGPGLNQATALDSVLLTRDPFPVVNAADLLNLGADRNTRVILFLMNLQLAQGEAASSVVVSLIDSNNRSYDVAAEDVRLVPNFSFTQVIFRLPNNLPVGTCTVTVKAHGLSSNAGTLRIRN